MTDSVGGCGPAVHVHNYPSDGRMEQALTLLRSLSKKMESVMALVDEFRAEIAHLREIRPAMEAAFARIEARLDAALADDADEAAMRTQLEAVRDELRAERTALADAVLANTPAEDPSPPPAPPAPEVQPEPVPPGPQPDPAPPQA